jgi:Flp pilus assembly secretin CpaC
MKPGALLAIIWTLSTMVFAQGPGDLGAPDFAGANAGLTEAQKRAPFRAKWNVCIDVQMVELEETKALELIPDLQSADAAKTDQASNRIQAMLKAGEAKLVAWPTVWAVDGSRAVSETGFEKRTATEFEPPQEPTTGIVPPQAKPAPVNAETVESTPIAFEMRQQGLILEVEPQVLSDGARIYLRLDVSSVKLLEMQDFGRVLTSHNTLITVPQPLFEWLRTRSELGLKSGQRRLIAIHRLAKPGNTIELDLVRAVAGKVE